MKRSKSHKRSFLLIELLLSLALIALCFFPLIKPHAIMRKADIIHLEEIQLERIAQSAFCEIKKILYETELHAWKDLCLLENQLLDQSFTIYLNRKATKEIYCSYSTKYLDDVKKISEKKKGLLLEITMCFSPILSHKTYQRTLYLERIGVGV